ncbi:hypothetical protein [Paraburkholderia sp. C35]|uniref:hypothetical protein n=1 Tax=Paraburkholderia sp. C35 TaxID=2126993 RepID=UPI000D68D5F4|nr:hypothetical protein [Paraburkholderia sp. C35]
MKIVQLIVAAANAIPAVSAFAQSTPPSVNEDIRAQLAQQKTAYPYADATDQTQASINDTKRAGLLPHQITGMNMGRYSLSVVRPSF